MTKIWICLIGLLGIAGTAHSQGLRLNLYGNYVFDDNVESAYNSYNYFNANIQGGFLWGAGLEFRLHEYYGAELMYFRQDTKAHVNYSTTGIAKVGDWNMGLNWVMLGGSRTMHASDKVEPYGGLMLGMAFIDAHNNVTNDHGSVSKFAWGLKLGTNIWVTDAVGIKLQAQLLSAVQAAGGSLYVGTGGAGAGVSTYSTMLQFLLGGGLTFRFGGSHH